MSKKKNNKTEETEYNTFNEELNALVFGVANRNILSPLPLVFTLVGKATEILFYVMRDEEDTKSEVYKALMAAIDSAAKENEQ